MDHGLLRVVELFAGVGGFRLGLEAANEVTGAQRRFAVVWSNQWEPGSRRQHASEIYTTRFGPKGHCNVDIRQVLADDALYAGVRSAHPDVVVGGFPCQDYSVANTLARSAGLAGEKGSLWWAMHALVRRLNDDGAPVRYLVLENVDRLLASPKGCPGRDFAVILSSLQALGYAVEWRVVNAADFGFPQRRRRTFIVAYHLSTALGRQLQEAASDSLGCAWLERRGVLTNAFPMVAVASSLSCVGIGTDPVEVHTAWDERTSMSSPFRSAGMLGRGHAVSLTLKPAAARGYFAFTGRDRPMTLGDVVGETESVPDEFFLSAASLPAWEYLKGGKRLERITEGGHAYVYSEGAVAFPDALDRPSRTLITSEGGVAPARTRHVVRDRTGRLRRLLPEELEQLQGFPRGFTDAPGVSSSRRAFLMGNALVVGLVQRLAEQLLVAVNSAELTAPADPPAITDTLTR
jgi:DNA (cytosine-5)-methyltransferase 1